MRKVVVSLGERLLHHSLWLMLLITGVMALPVWGQQNAPEASDILTLSKARAQYTVISAQGQTLTTIRPTAPVDLPDRWEGNDQHANARIVYQFDLPATTVSTPMALWLPHVGNQVEVRLGGNVVMRVGTLGDDRINARGEPILIPIASPSLNRTQSTPLEIEVTAQYGRYGGLSPIYFGAEQVLRPRYRSALISYAWPNVAMLILFPLIAFIVGGMWRQQHEPMFGTFTLALLFGMIYPLDRLLQETPLPWQLWGSLSAATYATHMLLLMRFAIQTLSPRIPWLSAAFWAYITWSWVTSFLMYTLDQSIVRTAQLGSMLLPGVLVLYTCWVALIKGSVEARILSVASMIVVLSGMHDFFRVHLSRQANYTLLSPSIVLLILFMAWIILRRNALLLKNYTDLNANLAQRVALREAELQISHKELLIQKEQQAMQHERQRIMRDIHDGVGSQLVGLMSLLHKGSIEPGAIQKHVQVALDELRMAVDALQPANDDLSTVLATLRFRLQPRLQAAGLEMQWQVEEMPPMVDLRPEVVLQIQRILLEAFTNVLRHAKASRVAVLAHQIKSTSTWVLEVSDNGIGLPAGVTQALAQSTDSGSTKSLGHGLRNMQTRAAAIGGKLSFGSCQDGGSFVRLELSQALSPTVRA